MIHTIRAAISDDELFRKILRGLNKTFYHQTVTAKQVEDYISKESGKDFSKVFEQYLLNTEIPVLEYKVVDGKVNYRWTNCVKGFDLPVKVNGDVWIRPSEGWQTLDAGELRVDRNFYVFIKSV